MQACEWWQPVQCPQTKVSSGLGSGLGAVVGFPEGFILGRGSWHSHGRAAGA